MENRMTVKEVLGATAQLLEGICVPAGLAESIGLPVCNAAKNLRACLQAIEEAESNGREADAE